MSISLFNVVTYDQSTVLYTYDYTVQNNSTSTVTEINLLIATLMYQPIIPLSTQPPGWTLEAAFSGGISSPPYNELGVFYGWRDGVVQPNTTAGFSITTRFAPSGYGGANDFFLFGSEGIVAYGNITVPSNADWIQPPVPEPATWIMLLIGFIAIACTAKRRSRRFAVHPAPLSLARRYL